MKRDNTQMSSPLFFLFTCVKDGRKYIGKLFDSLLQQTNTNFVHYIYEDGSSDPIEDLASDYKDKASRLIKPYEVIYEKNPINIGLNLATKHCIEKCCCPFFIWIDCDNWVEKDFFKGLEETAIKYPSAILIRTMLEGPGLKHNKFYLQTKKTIYKKDQLKPFLFNKYYYSFFAVNYSEFLKINPSLFMVPDRSYFNDRQVLVPCILSNERIAMSRKSIGHFLVRDDSESITFTLNEDLFQRASKYRITVSNVSSLDLHYFDTYVWMIKSFWEMDSIRLSNPKESLAIFYKRRECFKKNKIGRDVLYLYGNRFTWFLRIAILKLRIKSQRFTNDVSNK